MFGRDLDTPMSSRKDSTVAQERRIRRIAVRHDLHILKVQKPDAKVRAHGGYMLREAGSSKIVFGDNSYPFSADFDEIEAFLVKLDEGKR
jgi:hypothetical protein